METQHDPGVSPEAEPSKALRTPPYISFSTLKTTFAELKENGIPPEIDRSVLTRFSGGVQGQLIIALRALNLIADGDAPTPALKALVEAYETDDFKPLLRSLIERCYPYVFELDLMNATPSMFAKAFSENLTAKEDVLRKCRTFFLHAAREADIPMGARIANAKFPRSRSSSARRAAAKVQNGSKPEVLDAPEAPAPISEKALEYRLVDLMSEAAGEPEVMQSIINVITFLKTKEVLPTRTADKDDLEEVL